MYGIECYVSRHEGFFGKIKEKCEDFEVHEIDLEGNIAQPAGSKEDVKVKCSGETLDCTPDECDQMIVAQAHSLPKPCDRLLCKAPAIITLPVTTEQNFKVNDLEDQDKKMKVFEYGDKQPFEVLKELLDSSVLVQLEGSQFDDASQFVTSNLRKLEISAGIVDEKGIRTILHQCIRYVYPHLKSIVSKTDDGHSEIKVLFDSAYGDFFDAGIAKEAVDNIFRFIHCQFIVKDKSTLAVEVGESKQQRTHIHRLIRQHYGSFLESKTFISDDMAIPTEINVRFKSKRKAPAKASSFTEKPIAPIYKFVLCKRNIEISDAISKLSHALKVKPSAFSFAGTKDKKAITYQYVTTNDIGYDDLEKFAMLSEGRDIEISRVRKVQCMLRLGDLNGNMFRVVLRGVELESEKNFEEMLARIKAAIDNVNVNGFVNYFGEQRFGFEGNPFSSADIGLAMLRGDFVKAVTLILSPTGQGGEVDDAKKYFHETRDVVGAWKRMPAWKTRETCILRGLKQHGYSEYGCCQALLGLPYNVRLMYVHSYSSLLWNKMASRRIKTYGLQPTEGDLVLSSDDDESPVALSEKEVSTHRISDVVLPLPGFRVAYPSNLAAAYEGALREDGLERENFRIRKVRLNVPGVYRKLLSYPKDMLWSLQSSDGACFEYQGNSANTQASYEIGRHNNENRQRNMLSRDAGSQTNVHLRLQFSLTSSSYATIYLRELMHNTCHKSSN